VLGRSPGKVTMTRESRDFGGLCFRLFKFSDKQGTCVFGLLSFSDIRTSWVFGRWCFRRYDLIVFSNVGVFKHARKIAFSGVVFVFGHTSNLRFRMLAFSDMRAKCVFGRCWRFRHRPTKDMRQLVT